MHSFVTWQSRPVFVTSTFCDMHAERDHFHDYVFPHSRSACAIGSTTSIRSTCDSA